MIDSAAVPAPEGAPRKRRRRGGRGRKKAGAAQAAPAAGAEAEAEFEEEAPARAAPPPKAPRPEKAAAPKPAAPKPAPKKPEPASELGLTYIDPEEPVAIKFADLDISDQMVWNLEDMGFEKPTPIQAHAIPPALTGKDLIGCAQTGTGKTAAFGIPMIERIHGRAGLYGLILAPTRELAVQIEGSLKLLAKDTGVRIGLIYGGTPIVSSQAVLSAGVDILIATPGRFLDMHERGTIWEEYIECFVLDEADRMLDMGFEEQLDKIMGLLPKKRQTMLFSATMPKEVVSLIKRAGMKDPLRIQVGVTARPVDLVEQRLVETTRAAKERTLIELLDDEPGSTLVFVRTKIGCEQLFRTLKRERFKCTRMHGGRDQEDREAALEDFREGAARILVATEVAARGLDVAGVAHVINYDMPDDPEEYVHRIGRTGRAGASGLATSLATPLERPKVDAVERLIGRRLPRAGDQRWTESDLSERPVHPKRSHGPNRNRHRRR